MEVFDDLISAIQEAVIRAHETSEQQHVRMMSRFFDSDTGEPKTLALSLPFLDPGNSEIQYKEVSAEVEFQGVKSVNGENKISAKLRGGGFGKKANRAKIRITVEGVDPPEALLKLNDTIVKVLP